MNKMKRLTALLLALMMILSTFAAAEPAYQLGEMTSDDWQTIVDRAYAIVGTPTIDEGGVVVRPEIPDQPTIGETSDGKQYLVTTTADLSAGAAEATLYNSGQLVLTGVAADQWQINVGNDVWVNIVGEAGETIVVTNAMVDWLGDAVQVRQVGTPDHIASISIIEYVETMLMVAAARSASTVAEEAIPTAANDIMTLEETNQFSVAINYVYTNNDVAASPYTASLGKGTPFSATVEIPKIPGYEATINEAALPAGVEYENGTIKIAVSSMDADIIVNVVYQPGQVTYTVKHYQQKVEDDGYTLYETTTGTGTTGEKVPDKAVAKEYEGFYALLYEQPEIAADGSTVVEIHYDRYYRLMNFDLGGGYGVDPIYARYGTTIPEIGKPTKAGYEFKGWATSQENADAGIADAKIPATMPSEHTKFYAVWDMNENAKVSIVFWGENPNDEGYSYLKTGEVTASSGTEYTYNDGDTVYMLCDLEEHKHGVDCALTCGKEEHTTHTVECIVCTHTHTLDCYQSRDYYTLRETTPGQTINPTKGDGVYTYTTTGYRTETHYYLYLGGKWYCYYGNIAGNKSDTQSISECSHVHSDTCYNCEYHEHSDKCYGCGKEEHTHDSTCNQELDGLNTALWKFIRSETVTVAPDGSSVVNVYYDRTSFTMTFKNEGSDGATLGTITDKWGADIETRFENISKANTFFWSLKQNGGSPWTSFMDIMPQENRTYYADPQSGSTQLTATYYTQNVTGTAYDVAYTVSFRGSSSISVTKEEFVDIEGFTFNDPKSTDTGSSYNGAKFYYDRNKYCIEFYNPTDLIKKSDPIYYQASIEGQYFVPGNEWIPSTYEPGSVYFDGWYLNPECTGEEYDFTGKTMPVSAGAANGATTLTLYAKWAPKTYTVNFYLTEDTMNQNLDWIYDPDGDADTKPASFLVEHGGNIIESYVKAHLDYDAMIAADPFAPYNFVAWFYYDENGDKQPFDPTMQIRQNLNLFAEWTSDLMVSYTIKYVYETTDENGNKVEINVAAPTTGSALGGNSETFEAKGDTELYPDYQVGYFPHTMSHTLNFNETNADGTPVVEYEYTFYYTSEEAVAYTVYYVTETQPTDPTLASLGEVKLNGKKYYLVHATKTDEKNRKAVVTENFVAVNGYMPDAFQKRLVVTPDGDNTIIFYYTKDDKHAYYQVTHWIRNIDDNDWVEYTTPSQIIGDIGTTDYADDPMNIDGFTYSKTDYVVNGEIVDVPEGGYKLTSDGLAINLYYTRNKYPYVVHYYLENTKTPLADDKTGTEPYEKLVNEVAIDIPGYEAVAPTAKSITIASDTSKNVIEFYYREKWATINYIPTPAAGGTVSVGSETIGMKTGVAVGSTATANEHYTFKGWYTDAECTKPVTTEGTLSNNGTTFVPTKAEDALWTSTTYYAKFEENTADIEYIAVLRNADGTLSVKNATGGTVNQKVSDKETVPVVTGTPNGAIAVAKAPTYKFVGWYSDETCKTLVSTDAAFAPDQIDGAYVDAQYYALFELDVADLTITKTVENSASGATAPADDKFTIQVKLTPANGAKLDEKYSYTKTNGTTVTEDELTVSGDVLTLSEVKDGDVIVIKGIVIGTGYKVSETAKPDYYIATYTGADGTVVAPTTDSVNRVGVTNTYQTGHLTITKTVTGVDADDIPTDAVYTFTVKNSANKEVGKINLAHGQSATISNLPIGDYTVTEGTPANIADYTFVKVQANGADSDSASVKVIDNDTVTVPYTNVYKKNTAVLTVEKTVVASTAGTTAPADDEFRIKITFTAKANSAYGLPTTYKLNNGEPKPLTLTNGAVELPVKAGDKITFPEVVIDTQYTVEEISKDGYYEVSYANAAGTIAADATATVTNTYKTGSLTISKTVEGDTAPDDTFTFELALSSKHATYSYTKTAADGATTNDSVAYNGTVELKAGESVTIMGIPAGTDYTVTETHDDDYITTPAHATGKIKKDSTVEAAFTNTYQRGDLTITKQVVNNTGVDRSGDAFEFTITLSDTSINGTYGPVTFTDGIGKTTLKAGESVTIKDLPKNVGYTVTEADVLGYADESTGATGTIEAGKVSTAAFTNTYEVVELKITKKVVGNTAPADDTFNFTVTLTDTITNAKLTGSVKYSIDGGEAQTANLENGAFQLTLKKGQTATIAKLPKGVTYAVVEATEEYYTTEYDSMQNGTITKDSVSTTVTNTYLRGDLTIGKRVEPEGENSGKPFTFTLALSDEEHDYAYVIKDANDGEQGKGSIGNGDIFTLYEGWYITLKDLPKDTSFTVTETLVTGYATYVSMDGTVDKETGNTNIASGEIVAGQEKTVWFVNIYGLGSLNIIKNVVGSAAGDSFKFKLTVTDEHGNRLVGVFPLAIIYNEDGQKVERIDEVDTRKPFEFEMKAGWSALISRLPEGTKYTIEEIPNSAYDTYVKENIVDTAAEEQNYGAQINSASGSIPKEDMHQVIFTNVYRYSTLTIKKTGMETGESAIFEVTAYSKYNNDQKTTFTVSVPNGGEVTIGELLIGSDYAITEIGSWSNRYAVAKPVTGQIDKNGSEVTITNTDKNNQWLHDEDYVHNDFSTPGDYPKN